jgi:uncharacterized damage-inducible protein DinB
MSRSNVEMERIEASWKDLAELFDQLQDADGLNRTGKDGWTVKDHLVHVAAWEHSLLGLIEGRNRLEAMGVHEQVDQDTDAINDAVRKLHQSDTAEEALGYFRESHLQLTAALGKLSDADLQKPYSHYQPGDPSQMRPVVDWVAGNTYEHYAEHIGWINHLISESSAPR